MRKLNKKIKLRYLRNEPSKQMEQNASAFQHDERANAMIDVSEDLINIHPSECLFPHSTLVSSKLCCLCAVKTSSLLFRLYK